MSKKAKKILRKSSVKICFVSKQKYGKFRENYLQYFTTFYGSIFFPSNLILRS